jgi:hypothetical protein
MRVKPLHQSISSSTQRPRQKIHPQPESQDNKSIFNLKVKTKKKKKKKKKKKSPQVAAKKHDIVNIHSEDTL